MPRFTPEYGGIMGGNMGENLSLFRKYLGTNDNPPAGTKDNPPADKGDNPGTGAGPGPDQEEGAK